MAEKTILERNAEYVEKEDLDAACKRLLANKVILSRILKSCVEEFKDCSLQDIEEKYIEGEPRVAVTPVHRHTGVLIKGIRNEDSSMEEGTVTYDIIFEVISPKGKRTMTMMVNIECQASLYPGYPLVKRGVYYGGRMISSQYGTVFTKSHYEKLEKVYSIWICVNPPKYRRNSINSYSIIEQKLLGNVCEKRENYDLLTVAILCLGDEDDANCEGILRLLTVLFSDKIETEEKKRILEEDFDIEMGKDAESEVYEMCNYGDYVERRGIEKGIERGLLSSIKNLMDTMEWTAEQAMNALKIEKMQQKKYLQMLEENIA